MLSAGLPESYRKLNNYLPKKSVAAYN